MATKFLNRYGESLNEINYDNNQYALLNHTHTISDITNLQSTLDGKLSTSAAAAAAKEMYSHVHLTDPDSENNTNFRLIYTHNVGTWNNYRGIFVVNSRHAGSGLLSIALGCNSDTVNAANCYGEICYYGTHLSSSGGPIDADSWQIYVSSDGKKLYIIWKIYDYSDTYVYKLASDFNLTNGTSLGSSIPSSYGTRKCQTTICYGENSSYNSRITTLENFMNKYSGMLNIIGNNA